MEAIGIIPARYAATRFEGKVLADIFGKPMLQYVWEAARGAKVLDEVIIACDDERIKKAAEEFGAHVVLTSKGHLSGSDRIVEIVNTLEVKVVVNIQADEPLLEPAMINNLTLALLEDPAVPMATLGKPNPTEEELLDPNVVKVVVDRHGFALYFSRANIPYLRNQDAAVTCRKHIGIYAFTKDFLFTFKNLPPSSLEKAESLEQLRVLEAGFRIKVVDTPHDTIGVDTPRDLERVKERLKQR